MKSFKLIFATAMLGGVLGSGVLAHEGLTQAEQTDLAMVEAFNNCVSYKLDAQTDALDKFHKERAQMDPYESSALFDEQFSAPAGRQCDAELGIDSAERVLKSLQLIDKYGTGVFDP